jgi:hypothetical protein
LNFSSLLVAVVVLQLLVAVEELVLVPTQAMFFKRVQTTLSLLELVVLAVLAIRKMVQTELIHHSRYLLLMAVAVVEH